MATPKKQNATPAEETSQDVDRVREIIFGPQMRDYDQRFQLVQRDLERLQQDLDRLTEELAEQGQNQTKKLQQLRQEVRQSDDDLRHELRQTAQQLTLDKVDRVALGELFTELGQHLKSGGSLADLLKDLQDKIE